MQLYPADSGVLNLRPHPVVWHGATVLMLCLQYSGMLIYVDFGIYCPYLWGQVIQPTTDYNRLSQCISSSPCFLSVLIHFHRFVSVSRSLSLHLLRSPCLFFPPPPPSVSEEVSLTGYLTGEKSAGRVAFF